MTVIFPRHVAAGPGGKPLTLCGPGVRAPKHPGDDAVEVPNDPFVRRRERAGDLEYVTEQAPAPAPAQPEPEPAPAPPSSSRAATAPTMAVQAPAHTAKE
jgi:hypothetical protein